MFIYNTIDSEANMNSAKVPPVLSMLFAAREIFNSRRNFRLIFLFTFLSGLFILIEFIFFITFIVSNITVIKAVSLDIVVTISIVLGFPLLLFAPFIIYYSRTGVKRFESFVSNFYPIFLKTEVDLFIPSSEYLRDSVISVLRSIDKDFEKAKVNPDISKKAVEVAGSFDIILKAKGKIAAVLIMKDNKIRNSIELKEIQLDAERLRLTLRKNFCLLVIVTTQEGNLKEAVPENVKKLRTIILEKTSSGFKLDYVSQ